MFSRKHFLLGRKGEIKTPNFSFSILCSGSRLHKPPIKDESNVYRLYGIRRGSLSSISKHRGLSRWSDGAIVRWRWCNAAMLPWYPADNATRRWRWCDAISRHRYAIDFIAHASLAWKWRQCYFVIIGYYDVSIPRQASCMLVFINKLYFQTYISFTMFIFRF